MFIGSVVFVILLAATCGAIVQRRHSVMRLRWPNGLDYYPFRQRLRSFIAHSGFKVNICPEIPFDLEANINGQPFLFICVPDNASIVSTKMIDWAALKTYRGQGRQLVCVTANPVHSHLAREASERSFTLIHYKELNRFFSAAA